MSLMEKLKDKKRIFILANSKADFDFSGFDINELDVLIIFNELEKLEKIESFSNLIWVHRHNEWGGNFFGENYVRSFKNKNVAHIAIANYEMPKPKWAEDIIFINEMPNICLYPIGKKVFGLRRKFIKSPSSGYVVLEIINNISAQINEKLIYAIGFGQFPNGWYEHAWGFERRRMSSFGIVFLSKEMNIDKKIYLRGLIPDFVANMIFDFFKKWKIKN